MKKYLARFVGNYADEFDLDGIQVWTEDEVDEFKAAAKRYFKVNDELEIYFGTNEAMTWYSAEDVINDVSFKEISNEEANMLTRLFSDGHWTNWPGYFPDFMDYLSEAEEEDEDYDEDDDDEDYDE